MKKIKEIKIMNVWQNLIGLTLKELVGRTSYQSLYTSESNCVNTPAKFDHDIFKYL